MSTVRKIDPQEKGLKVRKERPLKPFRHGMDEFFENMFGNFPGRWMGAMNDPFRTEFPMWKEFADFNEASFPRVDMIDREKELLVRAELPGVRKQDLEISILGDRLVIQGMREYKQEKKDDTYFRSEIGRGTTSRTVMLPAEVDEKKVKAELKDGILEVTLPKTEVHKRHTIKVA